MSQSVYRLVTRDFIFRKNIVITILAILTILLCSGFTYLGIYTINETKRLRDLATSYSTEAISLSAKLKTYEADTDKIAKVIHKANPRLSSNEAKNFAIKEFKYANYYNFDKSLVIALTKTESGYNCGQVSWNGSSYGCKQINYKVWKNHFKLKNPNELFNNENNMIIGYEILNMYRKQAKHDTRKMLELYYGRDLNGYHKVYASKVLKESYNIDRYLRA